MSFEGRRLSWGGEDTSCSPKARPFTLHFGQWVYLDSFVEQIGYKVLIFYASKMFSGGTI